MAQNRKKLGENRHFWIFNFFSSNNQWEKSVALYSWKNWSKAWHISFNPYMTGTTMFYIQMEIQLTLEKFTLHSNIRRWFYSSKIKWHLIPNSIRFRCHFSVHTLVRGPYRRMWECVACVVQCVFYSLILASSNFFFFREGKMIARGLNWD